MRRRPRRPRQASPSRGHRRSRGGNTSNHFEYHPRDMGSTVRDATFDVLRRYGLTTLFANPGSTEVPFLTGLPDDLRFVLGLHEASVIGMATGFALGRNEPALALLHTTPGLGT